MCITLISFTEWPRYNRTCISFQQAVSPWKSKILYLCTSYYGCSRRIALVYGRAHLLCQIPAKCKTMWLGQRDTNQHQTTLEAWQAQDCFLAATRVRDDLYQLGQTFARSGANINHRHYLWSLSNGCTISQVGVIVHWRIKSQDNDSGSQEGLV